MKKKLQSLLEELNHGLIDRHEAVKLSLLAALAGEHMLLVGPPGTGKSMIARRISECFNGSEVDAEKNYFEYLLTKFSTPEEIFGPLSISELKADRFKRNTAGYLPTVKVAFLDEIFKASSSILNALLTILNERVYHNGTERQKVPLQSLIAASNELPVGQDELGALYDRFLVRGFVDYVSTDSLSRFFDDDTSSSCCATHLGEAELKAIREAAIAVTLPILVQEVIQDIWIRHKEVFKEDRREQLSDRRLKKVINLLRVVAATNDRREVDFSDLLLLKNCLWNHPDNSLKVQSLVLDAVRHHSRSIPICEGVVSLSAPTEGKQVRSKAKRKGISGYLGAGTALDPIRVGTVDELLGLARPEVGVMGYYFRQTANIDCYALTSWDSIAFMGVYDGAGFDIRSPGGVGPSEQEWVRRAIFSVIGKNSRISKVKLLGCDLSIEANGVQVVNCEADGKLIAGKAQDSQFLGCLTGDSLIGGEAIGCDISRCQSGSFLVRGDKYTPTFARRCTISDSLVVLNYSGSGDEYAGGLVQCLVEDSLAERCLVTGRCSYSGRGFFNFSGMASSCLGSQIINCALGPFEKSSGDVKVIDRIAAADGAGTLHNNASIDSVTADEACSKPDGQDGRSVPAAAFNQYFFEHTLGWDFSETWQWNLTTQLPALRGIGANAEPPLAGPQQKAASIDPLSQQLRANIWS